MEGLETLPKATSAMTLLRELLTGAIDYAGLFPPASLGMEEVVRNYTAYRHGAHAWMLGRCIIPVARLTECSTVRKTLPPHLRTGLPWKLAALAGADLATDLGTIADFNAPGGPGSSAGMQVDTVEFNVRSGPDIDTARALIPGHISAFAEIPIAGDPAPLIAMLSGAGFRAKVRTGGVTPDAFPSAAHLSRFIVTCVRHRVVFKATAGLHHPLRGNYRLTYDARSREGTMFGFLQVLLAAALADAGGPEDEIRQLLEDEYPGGLQLDEEGVSWRTRRLSKAQLAGSRTYFAGFGSCSFSEPVNDLHQMGLL